MVNTVSLSNWEYRQHGDDAWHKSVSGAECTQIHADLIHNGEIEDPFMDMNEKKIQWVGEKVWEYRGVLQVDSGLSKYANNVLIFEGLDTFATVKLNGTKILSTDNMFCEYRVPVKDMLKFGEENVLEISFDSALLRARELEKENGKFVCWNGETCRLHIRKAPYHFGWDWGPVMMTCGPWQPVKLVSYDSRIDDFYTRTELKGNKALLNFQIEIDTVELCEVSIKVFDPSGSLVEKTKLAASGSGTHSTSIELDKPELWYPRAAGSPALHTIEVELLNKNGTVQTLKERIGIREVELVQEPLDKGASFYFKVNGVPVYCGGSNWIPAHSLLTMLTHKDYTEWLELAAEGNQSMIRVWGGGYYEDDFFYSECDRLGLLVWQDFMFACGQYPGDKKFLGMIEKEATHQLTRLRNHACLALFAGNNEDYQVAELSGLEWDPKDHSGDYSKTLFPARTIYEVVLPKLMKKLHPDVPYHPGSPWSGENPTTDPTNGDLHQWNVWHGTQEKYQDWYKLGGRFVSEFGMEALPNIQTYHDCITDKDQLHPQSEFVEHHNKADGFERRLALYVMENIKVDSMDLESWIYATQLMQAECLSFAYKCWRRSWKKDGQRENGGALVWQINDCWPVASWAIVDFYRRPKLGYYAVKRELQAVAIGILRVQGDKTSLHDYHEKPQKVDIWGVNASLKAQAGRIIVDIYDVTSGDKIKTLAEKDAVFEPNGCTELFGAIDITKHVAVHARLVDADGTVVCSASDWPQPLKHLQMPTANVHVEVLDGKVVVTTDKPVKGLELVGAKLSDNGFDLFPSETKTVHGDFHAGQTVPFKYYH